MKSKLVFLGPVNEVAAQQRLTDFAAGAGWELMSSEFIEDDQVTNDLYILNCIEPGPTDQACLEATNLITLADLTRLEAAEVWRRTALKQAANRRNMRRGTLFVRICRAMIARRITFSDADPRDFILTSPQDWLVRFGYIVPVEYAPAFKREVAALVDNEIIGTAVLIGLTEYDIMGLKGIANYRWSKVKDLRRHLLAQQDQ